MYHSAHQILWELMSKRRKLREELCLLFRNEDKMLVNEFQAEKEKLLRSLASVNAHILDAYNPEFKR